MTLGDVVFGMLERGYVFRPEGYFNIESGNFAIGNRYFEYCDCTVSTIGEIDCKVCPRGKGSNSIVFPSGDGDGIFVAWSIFLPPEDGREANTKVGLISFFDHRYETANYARGLIDQETLPIFPLTIADKFADCESVTAGSVDVDRTILIGDASAVLDGTYAVVDFPSITPGNYEVTIYSEIVDQTIEGTASRLAETQGMSEDEVYRSASVNAATFEKMIGTNSSIDPSPNPFPPIVPRAVIALHEDAVESLEETGWFDWNELEIDDWDLVANQFRFGRVVTAHKQSMAKSVVWENVRLANQYDISAGECSDEVAKRLIFNTRTWLYLGRELGDERCIAAIDSSVYQPTPEEEVYLYMRRGLLARASESLK